MNCLTLANMYGFNPYYLARRERFPTPIGTLYCKRIQLLVHRA